MTLTQNFSDSEKLHASDLRIGLLYTRQCNEIVDALVTSCRGQLLLKQVPRDNIYELQVNVPFELPFLVNQMLKSSNGGLDAVICIGCLVEGHSLAFEFVAEAVTRALMKLSLSSKVPVIDGVLACANMDQGKVCAGIVGGNLVHYNHGVEWANSAIAMAHFNQELMKNKKRNCNCREAKGQCDCGA